MSHERQHVWYRIFAICNRGLRYQELSVRGGERHSASGRHVPGLLQHRGGYLQKNQIQFFRRCFEIALYSDNVSTAATSCCLTVLIRVYTCFSLVFAVGDREVRDFRMIERHYFRDQVRSFPFYGYYVVLNSLLFLIVQLVKSFDFSFGFCIPGSVNTWESVYSLPPLDESLGITRYIPPIKVFASNCNLCGFSERNDRQPVRNAIGQLLLRERETDHAQQGILQGQRTILLLHT